MQNEDTITAYANAQPKKQEQKLPGSEKDLEPLAGVFSCLTVPNLAEHALQRSPTHLLLMLLDRTY